MRVLYTFAVAGGLMMLGSVNAVAIDRDADSIDAVEIAVSSYDNASRSVIRVRTERQMAETSPQWGMVASVSGGQFEPDGGADATCYGGSLGMKYYFSSLTSLLVEGAYMYYDAPGTFDTVGLNSELKHRLVSANGDVSPFILCAAAIEQADIPASASPLAADASFEELILGVGGGCDFVAGENMAFVLEARYSESRDLSDGFDYADGFTASFALQYYW